jgi:SOS response regulatory protein OraA/RecX
MRYAANILAARPYFSGRLREKLTLRAAKLNLSSAQEEIENIITDLKSNKFLDDRYLSQGYVRKELNKGWGPKIILLKLMRLGVERDLAQEALLTEADLAHQKSAIAHYLPKIRRYDKRIQINKLFQRGFNSAAVLGTFDSYASEG